MSEGRERPYDPSKPEIESDGGLVSASVAARRLRGGVPERGGPRSDGRRVQAVASSHGGWPLPSEPCAVNLASLSSSHDL